MTVDDEVEARTPEQRRPDVAELPRSTLVSTEGSQRSAFASTGRAASEQYDEARAMPYRQEVADRVPPYGLKGEKTTGVLALGDGRVLPAQDSGYDGPALRLPKPRAGMDGNLVTHVEAHSVASMRENGVKEAALYLNRVPCNFPHPAGNKPWGCENALERMLQPDEKLTVYGPDGYVRVFTGRSSAGSADVEGS